MKICVRFKVPKLSTIRTKQVFKERFQFELFTLQIKVKIIIFQICNLKKNINKVFYKQKCNKSKKNM